MFRYAVIIIALIGLGVGFYAAATTKQELPRPAPAQPPSINPYPRGIAATGLVEAATRNIAIAAPEPGQVAQVNVNVGDTIKKDQALFIIDKRPLEAELLRANAAKAQTEAELARLKSLPRPEDVPPLEAAVNRAAALLRDATDEYQRLQRTLQGAAATQSEVNRKKFAMEAAAADLEAAKANLARMKAGAWEKEISIAQAQLAKANADIEAICVRIDRLVVKSPIDGVVIKRNIEPGEFASPGSAGATGMSDPSMIIGDLSKLNVRAQVDQEDVALLRVGSAAVARPRGPGDTLMPMEMIRIEPMAMPKRQITGLASELVDTRIVEVLFRVADTKGLNVYPGQMVDVFIDAQHEAK